MAADDDRIGRALRELRRRSGLTMAQAAAAAAVSLRTYRDIESGQAGMARVDEVRRVFAVHDARARLSVWWKGAELDRIIDEAHAAIVEKVVAALVAYGWSVEPEVSFSEYGERGSVDVLAFHAGSGNGLVTEVKASWGSMEETNRTLDAKARLAPKLIEQRFGARPRAVSRLLIFPENMTLRRVADRHSSTLGRVYPQRGREVRVWLRRPNGEPIRGLWFLSNRADSATEEGPGSHAGHQSERIRPT
jgi:transcriptional regulator with XRE-family HTH domain